MKPVIIIPARYSSTRLPAKPLADICGLPMVVRVANQAIVAYGEDSVVVIATDDDRVKAVCEEHGLEVVMTSKNHDSGTDRIVEVYERMLEGGDANAETLFINVQGDEPLIPVGFLRDFGEFCKKNDSEMYTAATRIKDVDDLFDINSVKVVINKQSDALYFSRSALAVGRVSVEDFLPSKSNLRHIGIYAYTGGFLAKWKSLEASNLELAETLEQLRALDNGVSIKVQVVSDAPPHGVDTQYDLERVIKAVKEMESK